MTIQYDPGSKKWNITELKTDHKTDRPIENEVSITRPVTTWEWVRTGDKGGYYRQTTTQKTATVNVNGGYWDVINALNAAGIPNPEPWEPENALKAAQESTRRENEYNQSLNQQAEQLNNTNIKTNEAYNRVVALASNTQGGDYKQIRDQIRQLDVSNNVKTVLENNFKTFYRTEKLQKWDTALGAEPLYGEFDPNYYKNQNPAVAETWKKAVAEDDIDITERYGEEGYYLQHYTNQGKPAGLRGNAAEITEAASRYVEKKPTDSEIQDARDKQLGVDMGTWTDRMLKIPKVAEEWEKAKQGDEYWKELGKDNYLSVNKKDEFAILFRLSNREQDKQVVFEYNAGSGAGITDLEDAINEYTGEKAILEVKKFGALTQNVLTDTINELKKAKQKEQELSFLGNLGTFGEIMDINSTIADSLLGDTGVGGVLSMMGDSKTQDKLETALGNITGIRNSVIYNWQNWFDNVLLKKYEEDVDLNYKSEGEATETLKIEKDFAKNFVNNYLKPRFDYSRSMDEFIEYLDVRQAEKNPFQTEDMVSAVQTVAQLRSQAYLDEVKKASDRYFDADFYFNPTGNKSLESAYANQAATVADDWEKAKKGDEYWAKQAYRFGIDVNDKAAFARMHFQLKGQWLKYDPAKDILSPGAVEHEIYTNILPALKKEAEKQGTVFGLFLKPEEFADELLKGLDPSDKENWDKVLKEFNLESFKGTVDEVKDQIKEVLRGNSAQEIREQIKFLQERSKKPTQQLLGVSYIERPEDYTSKASKEESPLYKIFKDAGYKGTQDEFYENFFPDADRSEDTLLTKAALGSKLEMEKFDFSDPFAAMSTITKYLPDDEEDIKTTSEYRDTTDYDSYFRIGADEDTDYKSKTGSQILGEFTSFFKGF